jgi:hypothetical protein
MTDERPQPAEREKPPNLIASIAADVSDPANPMVILRLENAGIVVDFRMTAEAAGAFGMNIGKGLIQTAQQALAAGGPRLVVPNDAGSLLIPRPGTPPNGSRG